ncbi:MAG: Gfo/Idh/MocA family oxidoreductase [Verrucomicrobia bacterium]|nr:Gfo/Idh/MocA family oxidoreductase [Verrucomicrobiota bacterium]
MKNWTRKEFLRASLLGSGAALIAGQTRLYGQVAPAAGSANGDIRVAVMGVGAQGSSHMKDYLNKLPGARLVAICDADSDHLAKQAAVCEKAGVKVKTFSDYRKMLEDKDIDAIVIGSPNHQHSIMTIRSLEAGKDVYCEKPLSHNVWEGRQAVAASKKYSKNIVMAGTQNRSSLDIMEALEYANSGKLGKIQWARGLCYKLRDSIGKTTGPQKVPDSVDYNLWTGPADLIPSRRNGPRGGPIHYDWHWFWNYGGGDIANQGIHQMDVARWFIGESSLPKSVMSIGGRFGYDDDAETPNTLISVLNYEKAPLIFEVRGLPMKPGMQAMDAYRGGRVGVVVQYEQGYITVSEGGTVNIYDNTNKAPIKALKNGGNGAHRANFVKAVQNRKVVHGLVEECHYSSAACHLANVSYLVGAEKSNAAISESINKSAEASETFDRLLAHLKANEVDVATRKSVQGPVLMIDRKTEMFVGGEKVVTDAANKSPLRKRVGRGEFTIPQISPAVAKV